MKLLIFTDIHCAGTSVDYTDPNNPLYVHYKTFEWLAEVASVEGIDLTLFLGDLGNTNSFIELPALQVATQGMRYFKGEAIPGNHDQYSRNTNIDLLCVLEGLQVHREPTTVGYKDSGFTLSFLPFHHDMAVLRQNLAQLVANIKGVKGEHFLCSHCDMVGVTYSSRSMKVAEAGLHPDELSMFTAVFNGHMHPAYEFKNIINVGSALYRNYADDFFADNGQRGCIVYDTDTCSFKRILNPHTKFFATVTMEQFQKPEVQEQLTQHGNRFNVKILDVAPDMTKQLVKEHKEFASVTAIAQTGAMDVERHQVLTANADKDDILRNYVELTKPENLSSDKLVKIGKELIK